MPFAGTPAEDLSETPHFPHDRRRGNIPPRHIAGLLGTYRFQIPLMLVCKIYCVPVPPQGGTSLQLWLQIQQSQRIS